MSDILSTVTALRVTHMPIRAVPYTGSATANARATEGQAPSATVAPNRPGAPALSLAAVPAPAAPVAVPAWRSNSHAMAAPLPVDRTYFRDIAPVGGRVLVTLQPGTRAVRALRDKLATELVNGVDGFPVRVVQSFGDGPVIIASSDPADAARIFHPAHDANGVYAKLAALVPAPAAVS